MNYCNLIVTQFSLGNFREIIKHFCGIVHFGLETPERCLNLLLIWDENWAY